MTRDQWQELSSREQGLTPDTTLHEGVPQHLEEPLREWVRHALFSEAFARRVALRLHFTVSRSSNNEPAREALSYEIGEEFLLDVVDCMLYLDVAGENYAAHHRGEAAWFGDPVAELVQILEDGRSAYRVRAADADHHSGLERIVDATVTAAATTAVQSAETAGRDMAAKHLADAWAKAYALHPDPSGAYTDAVKAVEDVANPMFLPNAAGPTLGQVLRHWERDAPDKYELEILGKDAAPAGIAPLAAMARLLWEGHRDRHPGGQTSAPVTLEAARAAVHLAATIVEWLSTGVVRRKP